METQPRNAYELAVAKEKAIKAIIKINNKAISEMVKKCQELGASYFSCRNIINGTAHFDPKGLVEYIQEWDETGRQRKTIKEIMLEDE